MLVNGFQFSRASSYPGSPLKITRPVNFVSDFNIPTPSIIAKFKYKEFSNNILCTGMTRGVSKCQGNFDFKRIILLNGQRIPLK